MNYLKSLSLPIALAVTMIAFSANSILVRMALSEYHTDPTLFSLLRLVSGAMALWFLVLIVPRKNGLRTTSSPLPSLSQTAAAHRTRYRWLAPLALSIYVWGFSMAYQWLSAGTGALILFGCVQITLVGASLCFGEKTGWREWGGLLLAGVGLYYLLHNDLEPTAVAGYALMSLAGIAWGIYTYLGKTTQEPIRQSASNFSWASLPIGLAIIILWYLTTFATELQVKTFDFNNALTIDGLLLAIVSGAITSGCGYALWYVIVKKIRIFTSGVAQLSVPLLTAIAGVIFLHEELTPTMIISGILILTGVYLSQKR